MTGFAIEWRKAEVGSNVICRKMCQGIFFYDFWKGNKFCRFLLKFLWLMKKANFELFDRKVARGYGSCRRHPLCDLTINH